MRARVLAADGFAVPDFRQNPRCVAFDAFDAAMGALGLD